MLLGASDAEFRLKNTPMRRIPWLLLLAMVLVPGVAQAVQLHWSSGGNNLALSQNTRALLIVRADSSEVTLPRSWRLQWTADSSGIWFVAPDSLTACLLDTAKVSAIDPPLTLADSAANQITAHFCSAGSPSASTAYYVLDLIGGSVGKLKLVALDPADSTAIIESNEVTYNGGIVGDFSPAILRAATTHDTARLQVTIVGTNLSATSTLRVTAPDGLWSVPLTVTSQTVARGTAKRSASNRATSGRANSCAETTTLIASADVPSALPDAILEIGNQAGSIALAPVAGDQISALAASLPDTVLFRDPNWTSNSATTVYPKDFAFIYNVVATTNGPWRGLFHLIYIRHNNNYSGDAAESLLVHAWSPDLRNWKVDKRAFSPNFADGAAWDHLHVWAPSLLPVGNQFYMFYTGVDANHNERIGYVTTSLLDTSDTQWSSTRTEVYAAANTGWADPVGHLPGFLNQQQFRDPFLMPDPDHAGKYLLFNVGEDRNPLYNGLGRMICGVAQNAPSSLNSWVDKGPYLKTDYGHTLISRAEAPLVMRDSTIGAPWRIFLANSSYDDVGDNSTKFITEQIGAAVSDTSLGVWSDTTNLFTYLGSDHNLYGWEACEHVQVGPYHFFAGYNGDGIAITRTRWDPSTQSFRIGDPVTAVGCESAIAGLRFALLNFRPGVRPLRFVLESSQIVTPHLILFDLVGRKVRSLLNGQAFSGRREVQWDCRDASGAPVPAGVYFARLSGAGPQQVRRVVIVR